MQSEILDDTGTEIIRNNTIKIKTNVTELFENARIENTYLKICAPMVRYSKLEFRTLVRKYGCDLCFTPMTMADSFCQSSKARYNEFSTSTGDTPVIAQFAAKNRAEYLSAAEMVYPYVDGIDLNCGCPQRWAMETGYGSAMLKNPELIKDLTSTLKRNLSSKFSVSVKLRIVKPLEKTIELCRQLEHCGVTFITVHGRTPSQKTKDPSNVEALAEIKKSISIPLVANGDAKSFQTADEMFERIKCDGVMAARGILTNPAMFNSNYSQTPIECVQDWVDICSSRGDSITFQCFHHHLTFMMEKLMCRRVRVIFNSFTKKQEVYDFLSENYGIIPHSTLKQTLNFELGEIINCIYDDSLYKERIKQCEIDEYVEEQKRQGLSYDSSTTNGKYFTSKMENTKNSDYGLDFMECNLFDNDEI